MGVLTLTLHYGLPGHHYRYRPLMLHFGGTQQA